MIETIYDKPIINQTRYWCGTDSELEFQSNLKNPARRALLEKNGWIDSNIEYMFNSEGFRSVEFDTNTPGFITLGCSMTNGIGLYFDQIWPEVLSKKLGMPAWNLGAHGTGLDTAYRLAEFYIQKLKPTAVVLLAPENTRYELWAGARAPMHLNHVAFGGVDGYLTDEFMKTWIAYDINPYYHGVKNIQSIGYICQHLGVDFYCYDVNQDFSAIQGTTMDLARDLQHNGPTCHQVFADQVYNDIINKKTYKPLFVVD